MTITSEVLFYHRGDFMSRDNIRAGMVSFHPEFHPWSASKGAGGVCSKRSGTRPMNMQ